MSSIYLLIFLASILMLVLYLMIIKNKEPWMIAVFLIISIADFGYFLYAASPNLIISIIANDITYFGSIFVVLAMYMVISRLCGVQLKRGYVITMILIGLGLLMIVCTSGWLPIYYKSVDFVREDGVSRLLREYGPLRRLHDVYLGVYYVAMIGTIVYAIKKHSVQVQKFSALLFSVSSLNFILWLIKKLFDLNFEILSASYVCSECIFFVLFWMMEDYVHKDQIEPIIVEKIIYQEGPAEQPNQIAADGIHKILTALPKEKRLTETETRILFMLLEHKTRREIAETMTISENTIKTHVSHIYKKLGVKSKLELSTYFK